MKKGSIESIDDILNEFKIILDHGCGQWEGRQVRIIESIGVFQIGDNNFDRWANSVEKEFDIVKLHI